MANDNSSSTSGGIGFAGLLTILLIGLKLTHYIEWNWWWVFAPIWLPWLVVLAFIVIIAIVKALTDN
jgi:Na+-translocating ferredoxin:NAD+ oxidoreductase RnfA subunit